MNTKLRPLAYVTTVFLTLIVVDVGRAQIQCDSVNPCVISCDQVDECSFLTIIAPEDQDTIIQFLAETVGVTVVSTPSSSFSVSASIEATLTDSTLPTLDVSVAPGHTVTDNVFRRSTVQFADGVTFDGCDFVGATLVGNQSAIDSSSFTNATFDATTVFPAGFGDPLLRGMIIVVQTNEVSWSALKARYD